MPASRSLASLHLVLLAGLLLNAGRAAAAEPKVEDLRRGLVASYRDAAKTEVQRLEPTIALALKAGEAPHPQLDGKSEKVTWRGYLNVVRGGTYRFRARVRGELRVTIDVKEALRAEETGGAAAWHESGEVKLEPGVHVFIVEFKRLAGPARVELFWEGPQFRSEPLNPDFLGHTAAQETEAFKKDVRAEDGRFLTEEMSCAKCHRAPDGNKVAQTLASRPGPDLSKVGQRVHAGWIERWLEAPQKLRPTAVMPELFGHDDTGKVERRAVGAYLASLGGPVPATKETKKDNGSINRGQKLYTSVGCIACHGPYPGKADAKKADAESGAIYGSPKVHPLFALGSKTTVERLTEYLSNPLAHDPSGRMPNMVLQGGEAQDLARFLCQSVDETIKADLSAPASADKVAEVFQLVENRPEELAAFKKLPDAEQWKDLGKRLIINRGCNNCHKIEPGGKPFAQVQASADLADLTKKKGRDATGCLADKPDDLGRAPKFPLTEAQRDAIRLFLRDGLEGAGSPAPGHAARTDLRRFNCLACHQRDGEGGLSTELVEELRRYEKADNAEAVSPPPLTGVAHKLRTPWLKQVLTGAGRARPWMGLRMPQFGEANVGKLPETLAALEGTETDDTVHKVALDTTKIQAGRQLVGKAAFGCVSCHDLAGIPNFGTRGPDLAGMNQRVRYEWYQRWLEQPQRIQPGTRMPSVFPEGKSLLHDVLGGSGDRQADAIWAYLSLGPTLPLPDGMEPPKGLILAVTDKPYILRTFMPDGGGSRAIAVGYPGGVSTSFDAHTCRLSYAWSGNFLDASPVWAGRGGNPAKLMGAKFWTAPPGCPVAATTSNEPPDFVGRASDPAYGGALPEGKVFRGTPLLRFEGYGTDAQGVPTFRYHLVVGESESVKVSERVEPLRAPAGVGVARRFTLEVPAKQTPWVLLGESADAPKLLDDKGEKKALSVKDGVAELSAAGQTLVLSQGGERVAVLAPASVPEGSRWRVQQVEKKWQVLLRVPTADKAAARRVDVHIWVPHRDDAGLLKELLAPKQQGERP
jgi:mono/diheme cytochrome c family protein